MANRRNPVADIDILRNTWRTWLDPTQNPPEKRPYGSKALINACREHRHLPVFSKRTTLRRSIYDTVAARWEELGLPGRIPAVRAFEQDKVNVKRLWDAGIRFGFGTDSGGASERYFIQGFYEHRQMELLVEAGLTPMQVIETFSKNNSEMLGIDKDFGTLAKGKAADLLVLAKNPLDDITNMRSFETVYLGGKKFE